MNMKKYISALALSLVLIFSFAFSAAAATAADSSASDVITGKISADGTTVTVVVSLAADTALTNAKASVTYDTAVYTLESAELGEAAEAADISDLNTENAGTVSAAFAEITGDVDGGTILTVVLTASSADDVTTPVTVTLSEAGTANGESTTEEDDDSFELTAVDKTALEETAEESGALEESSYTEESWAAYEEALAAAEAVLADENATQEEVDAALATLQAAIDALAEAEATETTTEDATETTTEEADATVAEEDTTTKGTSSTNGTASITADRDLMPLWILLVLSLAGAVLLAAKGKKRTA